MKKTTDLWNEGGYASATSVEAGKKLAFHVSTGVKRFSLEFYRLGATKVHRKAVSRHDGIPPSLYYRNISGWFHMGNSPLLSGKLYPPPAEGWRKGFRYPVAYELKIGKDWPTGFYYAQFPTLQGPRTIPFLVKPSPRPLKGARKLPRILYAIGDLTYQSYNSFGGKSIYEYNSTDEIASTHVTFNRPYNPTDALDGRWDAYLVPWLEMQGYPVDFCSQVDLARTPEILADYQAHIRNGHDEYWTKIERDAVEDYVLNGGHLASFSGNTCDSQVRLEDDFRTLICYRDPKKDPLYATRPKEVTGQYEIPPLNRPENQLLGAGMWKGGYVGSHGHFPLWDGNGAYQVTRPDHWIFKGTGLGKGSRFGISKSIVGYEVDGCVFKTENGLPVPTGEDGTPKNYEILAMAQANDGYATLGYYETPAGGKVFNAATTDWSHGLETDFHWQEPAVGIITRNILDRFLR